MELDINYILIIHVIGDSLRREGDKEKVDFNGKMDKYMMGNG